MHKLIVSRNASMFLLFFIVSQTLLAGNGGGGFIQIFDGKLKRADRYYENLEYAPAIKLYEKVLEKNDLPEVKLKLAESYRKINDHLNAEKWYSQIIYNSAIIEPVHKYNYAQTLISNGKYSEAQQWIQAYQLETGGNRNSDKIVTALSNIETFYADSLAFSLAELPLNSGASDFSPSYYKDGIVFVSSRNKGAKKFKWDESSFLDLYYAEALDADAMSSAIPFSNDINSKYHEGPVAFFDQDKRMIFTRSNFNEGNFGTSSEGVNTLQLYAAELNEDGTKWVNIQRLPFSQDEYSFGHPTVSVDGQRLYFVSDMPGGFGGTDIFMSQRQGDEWGAPQNLGDEINTLGNEMYPFIHQSNTLYFASNGHGGLGGLDIFSKKIDELSAPVKNLGYPLNSNHDDFGFIIDPEGRKGFVSSNRNGHDNILDVTINRVTVEPLIVDNQSNKPLPGVELKLMTDQGLEEILYPDEDGRVQIETIPGKEYSLLASREGYKDQVIHIEPDSDSEELPLTISMENENVDNSELENENVDKIKVNSLVISDESSLPLSNTEIKVFADGKEQETVFTDEEGRVEFDAIQGQDYTLLTKQDNFQDQIKLIHSETIAASNDEDEIVLAMEELSTSSSADKPVLLANNQDIKRESADGKRQVTINGIVIDRNTGNPITDSQVKLYEDGVEQEVAHTIEDGKIQFDAVPGKNYMLVANKDNYQEQIIAIPASSIVVDEEVEEEIILAMLPNNVDPKPIKAKVTDPESGAVLANAGIKLFVDNPDEEVNYEISDGIVSLDAEPGQNYMIIASHPAFKDRFINVSGDSLIKLDGNDLEIALAMDDQSSVDSDADSKQRLTLEGLVNDELDGSPIDDVHLKLFVDGTAEEIGFTNDGGKIDFDFVPGKDYMIMASKENFQDLIYHLPGDAVEGDEHSFELAMRPDQETVQPLAKDEATESIAADAGINNKNSESQFPEANQSETLIAEEVQPSDDTNLSAISDEDNDLPIDVGSEDYAISQEEDLWEQELLQQPEVPTELASDQQALANEPDLIAEDLNTPTEQALPDENAWKESKTSQIGGELDPEISTQPEMATSQQLLADQQDQTAAESAESMPIAPSTDTTSPLPDMDSSEPDFQSQTTSGEELVADQFNPSDNTIEDSNIAGTSPAEYVADNNTSSPEDIPLEQDQPEMATSQQLLADQQGETAAESPEAASTALDTDVDSSEPDFESQTISGQELAADQLNPGDNNTIEDSNIAGTSPAEYVADTNNTSSPEDIPLEQDQPEMASSQQLLADQQDKTAAESAESMLIAPGTDTTSPLSDMDSSEPDFQSQTTSYEELVADQLNPGDNNTIEDSNIAGTSPAEYVADNNNTSLPEDILWEQEQPEMASSQQLLADQQDETAAESPEAASTALDTDVDSSEPDFESQTISGQELAADQLNPGDNNTIEDSNIAGTSPAEYVADANNTSSPEDIPLEQDQPEMATSQQLLADQQDKTAAESAESMLIAPGTDTTSPLSDMDSSEPDFQSQTTSYEELVADQFNPSDNTIEDSNIAGTSPAEYVADANNTSSPEDIPLEQDQPEMATSQQLLADQQDKTAAESAESMLIAPGTDTTSPLSDMDSSEPDFQSQTTSYEELVADQFNPSDNTIEDSNIAGTSPAEYVADANNTSSPEDIPLEQDQPEMATSQQLLADQQDKTAAESAESMPIAPGTDMDSSEPGFQSQTISGEELAADQFNPSDNTIEDSNIAGTSPAEYVADNNTSSPEDIPLEQDQPEMATSQQLLGDPQGETAAELAESMPIAPGTDMDSSEPDFQSQTTSTLPGKSVAIPTEAIDGESMHKLEDTKVMVYADGEEQPAQYEEGTLSFNALPNKDYNMVISNPGYRDVVIDIPQQAIDHDNPEEMIVSLQEAVYSEASGEIASKQENQSSQEKELRLIDSDGIPLANTTAQLFVDGEQEATLKADDRGAVTVPIFEDRDHSILIDQPTLPNQIVEIDPMSWDDNHTEVIPGMVAPKKVNTFSDLKESGQWENSEVIVVEDLRGENQTYLSTDEQLYKVVKEGEDTYLVQNDQKILLTDSDKTQTDETNKADAERFYNNLSDEDKLYVDQVINQKLDITSPDDLPTESVESYYNNLSYDDQASVDHLGNSKAQVLGIPDPAVSSPSNGQDNNDPLLSQLVGEKGYKENGAITINNIYYDFDKSTIRKDAADELDKLASLLTQHKDLKLAMGSHTDVRGSSTYNEALSKRRAQTAVDYLLSKGISADRIVTDSYGESMPVNGCSDGKSCDESQHQLNRRTEFRVIQ